MHLSHETREDFYEYVAAAAEASDVGIILYNTHWTSANISMELVDKLIEIPNMAGLKWSVPNRVLDCTIRLTLLLQ